MNISSFNKLKLPHSTGIYIFKDNQNILYIGRATSIYSRVRSYFRNDLYKNRGQLIVDMVSRANNIEYRETDSILESIILESNEIKKHKPYYNTKEKDNKSYNFLIITDEDFPRLIIIRGRALELLNPGKLKFKIKYKFGPYPQGSLLKDALKIIRKIFPFRDAKASIKYQESFYRSLGLSPSIDIPEAKNEYRNIINNIVLLFNGQIKRLVKSMEMDMNRYSNIQDFEKAKSIRDKIYALNHIQDISLIKDELMSKVNNKDDFRIEAYDIAHIFGENVVGVMTVINNAEIDKNQYRKFKISVNSNNDIMCLNELLIRRLKHSEWKLPNLIVIDGGIAQFNIAKKIIKDIPIVSVVKDYKHKPNHILGDKKIIDKYKKLILLANSESHRFAISYHKSLRKKNFLL